MAVIDKRVDLSLQSGVEISKSTRDRHQQTNVRRNGSSVINDDFVIPHVGPNLTDDQVKDFAVNLAGKILDNPARAVKAQANQQEESVSNLTD